MVRYGTAPVIRTLVLLKPLVKDVEVLVHYVRSSRTKDIDGEGEGPDLPVTRAEGTGPPV